MPCFEKGSVFNAVPTGLRKEQRAWFDAVRGTCEAAVLAYSRLVRELSDPLLYKKEAARQPATEQMLADAWGFCDHAHRLRKLFQALSTFFGIPPEKSDVVRPPPPKTGYPAFKLARKLFERKLEGLVDVRDGAQHLDDKLRLLADMGIPVWGTLEWVHLTDSGKPGEPDIHFCSILPGYIFSGLAGPPISLREPIANLVGRVKLRAFGKILDLTEIRNAMGKPIAALETIFKPQFEGLPTMAISMFSRVIATTVPVSDEGSKAQVAAAPDK